MSPNSWFSQPVYLRGGDPEAVNEPTLLYPGQLGIRFQYNIPGRSAPGTESQSTSAGNPKGYQLVGTDSAMSVAPFDGAVAWFKDQSIYQVTTSPTSLGRGRVAGVFRGAPTPGNYTCIQIKGHGLVMFVDTPTAAPTAAGLIVIPSATAGKADCLAAGSAGTFPSMGRSVGAIQGGTGRAMVDLDLPEAY